MNCLLVCSNAMSYQSAHHFSPLLQYTTTTVFYTTINKINRYGSYILCLPREATKLKTSISFVARTMETRGPSIVLKTHKSLLARDTCLLADGIVDVRIMQGEHFAIYSAGHHTFPKFRSVITLERK